MKFTKKKFINMIVLFAVILLPGKFCLGSRDQFSAEKINAQISAKAFIAGTQKRAKNRLIDPNQLSQKIISNSGDYQDRAEAWNILQQEEKNDDLLKWYVKEITLILQGLNRNRPEGVDDFFTKEEREAFLKCPDQVVKAYLSKNFGKSAKDETTVFGKARKMACAAQFNKLMKNVYPSENEVDIAVAQGKISELQNKILEQLIKRQKEPVFSENVSMLSSDFVNPMLEDAKKQLKKQSLIVISSSGAIYVVPEDIGNFIKTEIIKYQNELKKQKQGKVIASKVYAFFPSVKSKIDERANEIAIKRFRDAISEMNFSASKDSLRKMIGGNLSAHSKEDQSWNSCLESFRASITNKAIDNHVAKSPESKRSDFRKFLGSLIFNSDQSCKDAMNELINRTLKQNFEAVRKEISQQQFKEFFGPLEKEIWKPSRDEIDKWYNKTVKISESEALKMPGVSSKLFSSANLLEETIEMIRKAEEAGIKTGLDALKSQMSMVEKLESQVKNQIENMSGLTINKVVKIYTEKVKSAWSSSEFAKDYANLFKRTQDEIKRRAKNILDLEIKRRAKVAADKAKVDKAQADAKAQFEDKGRSETFSGAEKQKGGGDKKPEGSGGAGGGGAGTGDGTGEDEGPAEKQEEIGDEMPDVIIDFGYESGRAYADIMFPKESKEKLRLFVDLNVNLNSFNMIIARKLFADWLKHNSQKAEEDQQEIDLYVFARIFHGSSVLYRMVYYFRECWIKALEDVDDERIIIHWRDRLFDKSGDVEKYKGKPILPPRFNKKLMPRLA